MNGSETVFTLTCDRCAGTSEVCDYYEADGSLFATGGYYRLDNLEGWGRFARPGESRICDACMHAEPGYIAVYGARS